MQTVQGSGCHAQIQSLTPEIVDKMHSSGKIVAVWIDTTAPKELYEENEAFYQNLYDLGVDMLTTDHPTRANEILQRYHHECENKKLNREL